MALTVTHPFVSAKADSADTSLVNPSNWNANHSLSGTVDIANGGTGQATATAAFDALAPTTTQGDIIYHNGSDNVRLAKGTAYQSLNMNAGATAPEWQASVQSLFTAQGDILYATGANAPAALAKGTANQVLAMNAGATAPEWKTLSAGSGDVVGPASSVDNEIALFDSTTGKLLKRATTTGVLKASSGVIAAATDGTDYLSSSTGIKQGLHTMWIPAVAMISRTTNGAAAGSVETSTNKLMIRSLDFDASTIEYAQFQIRMPKSWDESTITFAPTWTHGSTTTNFKVSWGLQAIAISDDDAIDAAFGTAQYSNDTGGTTDDCYVGPTSSAITIAGTPQAEDWVVFQVLRKADDGTNDTLAIDARLLGVTIYMTLNAATDA